VLWKVAVRLGFEVMSFDRHPPESTRANPDSLVR
jgi:hypothetical protein